MHDDRTLRRNVVILEPEVGGHQHEWLEHLVRWSREVAGSHIVWLVVAPQIQRELAATVPADLRDSVRIVAMHPIEQKLCANRSLVLSAFARWWVMRRYLALTGAHAGQFLSLDHLTLPLALGLGARGRKLSGILFRPSVHYRALGSGRPQIGERLRDLRKALLYPLMLRNRDLDVVLTLDPYFVGYAARHYRQGTKVQPVADPVHPILEDGKQAEPLIPRLPPRRTVLVLFGFITERKGVLKVLDALEMLPPQTAQRTAVILAGRIDDAIRDAFAARRERLANGPSTVWLHVEDRWLAPQEIAALVEQSDVVLAPYQRFVGSSGVLLWAARAGKCVLAQDYGLVGRLVADHHLGLAVDTSDVRALARGLNTIVQEGPEHFFDTHAASAFAAAHSAQSFALSVYSSVLGGTA
jgi:glycosyltransferase involved in cell wall biosynthesis